jgi:hypothetical protein
MRRLLRKRWVWCLAVVLAAVLCPLPFLLLGADRYDRVQPGMTESEVEKLLGSPILYTCDAHGPMNEKAVAFTSEMRSRFWDVVTVNYWDGRVVAKGKTTRTGAAVWWELLHKVGWKASAGPMPTAPSAAPLPPPPLPPEQARKIERVHGNIE